MSIFWGNEIQSKKSAVIEPELPMRLTQVTISPDAPNGAKASLIVKTEDTSVVLCTLVAGRSENAQLDLIFSPGCEVEFHVSGTASLHISGYYEVPEMFDDDMMMGSDEEEMDEMDEQTSANTKANAASRARLAALFGDEEGEGEDDDEYMPSDSEDGDHMIPEGECESDEDDLEGMIADQEKIQAAVDASSKKRKADASESAPAAKKSKGMDGGSVPVVKVQTASPASASGKGAAPAAKAAAKPAEASKKDSPKDSKATLAPSQQPLHKARLQDGVEIQDFEIGSGVEAKHGRVATVNYVGKLVKGGNVFDKGKKFRFRVGVDEVISGWHIGVAGMKVGGKRKLIIPPGAGYGARGAPPTIPPNAALEFDIVLTNVQ
eukprot:a676571_212.p2 GENE.a676571_212~~a676571_212.p2  ORF type:complete len:390 (-),score=182.24 a676571_212:45-1178(-)